MGLKGKEGVTHCGMVMVKDMDWVAFNSFPFSVQRRKKQSKPQANSMHLIREVLHQGSHNSIFLLLAQDVLLELAHCLCSDVGSGPLPHCAPPSRVFWQATALLFAPLPPLPCAFLQPPSCRRSGCQLQGKVVPLSWDLLFQEALQPGEQLSHRSCHLAQHLSLLEPKKGYGLAGGRAGVDPA